jgi:GTPase
MLIMTAFNINIPVIAIITMIDDISKPELDELLKNYKGMVKSLKISKIPLVVNSAHDLVLFSRNLEEKIHPIFLISNKTGEGLENLTHFLYLLPNKCIYNIDKCTEFDIQEHFSVDKKVIIGGIVLLGKIIISGEYFLGPDKSGSFKIVEVEDIHCKKIPVKFANQSQFSSLNIKGNNLKVQDIRKGMSLIDINENPVSTKVFEVELWSLDGIKQIRLKSEPLVTIRHIRQICKIKKEDKEDFLSISPEDGVKLIIEFKNYPEYIKKDDIILINEHSFKAFGKITNLIK